MIRSGWQLRRWLAREILDKDIGRKPPQKERRGPARDSRYRAWIRTLPCAACGCSWNVEAAHTGSDGGTSLKASDYSCVPLCCDCHTLGPLSYHQLGREEFELRHDLDLKALVKRLNRLWFDPQNRVA